MMIPLSNLISPIDFLILSSFNPKIAKRSETLSHVVGGLGWDRGGIRLATVLLGPPLV